jgi:hypothetical protein
MQTAAHDSRLRQIITCHDDDQPYSREAASSRSSSATSSSMSWAISTIFSSIFFSILRALRPASEPAFSMMILISLTSGTSNSISGIGRALKTCSSSSALAL